MDLPPLRKERARMGHPGLSSQGSGNRLEASPRVLRCSAGSAEANGRRRRSRTMNLTDPVADMLTRIRNAIRARHQKVDVPASKLKLEIARILREEGYISNFKPAEEEGHKVLRIYLKYGNNNEAAISNVERVSRPRLPGLCAAQRNSACPRRPGDQYPDHAARSYDRTPGAQAGRRRRSVVRDLVGKPALSC